MNKNEFRTLLANELAEFINLKITEFGAFVDFNMFGGGLTFTDFHKYLVNKIENNKEV